MTDETIANTLAYYKVSRGGAADMIAEHAGKDIRAMAAEIDRQRGLATDLADQSKRLRELADTRGKVLEKVRFYAEKNFAHTTDQHSRFVLGTIMGMVNQVVAMEVGT